MALRSQTQRLCLTLLLLAAPAAAEVIELKAEHGRSRWRVEGLLSMDGDALRFDAPGRRFSWRWAEIQQLELIRDRILVTGYRDRSLWRMYQDQDAEFRFSGTPDVERLYAFLSERMDQRLVARVALPPRDVLWRVPAKRLRKGRGAHGELIVEPGRILFVAQGHGESRVWRDSEINLISSSGPHQLTLTGYPPDGEYEFQLKQALDPVHYDALWRRLNRPRGLELLANQNKEN